jgi:glutathione S-transferase
MAPHAALAEVGVEYELARVERDSQGRSSAAYLAVNPSGLVPTLEDGDLVITESAAILLHLADRFPSVHLVPPVGTPERAKLYCWLIHLTNTVQPTLMHVIYPQRFGRTGVREAAASQAQSQFARIEAHLGDRSWLVGDNRSAADLLLFALVRFGRHLEPPAWDRERIRSHFLRVASLAGVQRMLAEECIELPRFPESSSISRAVPRQQHRPE